MATATLGPVQEQEVRLVLTMSEAQALMCLVGTGVGCDGPTHPVYAALYEVNVGTGPYHYKRGANGSLPQVVIPPKGCFT
jgi:hypothetical protein